MVDFPASGHVWCFMSQASFVPPRTILVASTMILALSNLDETCKPWVLLPIVVRFTLDISIYIIILPGFKMIYHKMNQAIQSYNALSFFSLFFPEVQLRKWRPGTWEADEQDVGMDRQDHGAEKLQHLGDRLSGWWMGENHQMLAKDWLYWQKQQVYHQIGFTVIIQVCDSLCNSAE